MAGRNSFTRLHACIFGDQNARARLENVSRYWGTCPLMYTYVDFSDATGTKLLCCAKQRSVQELSLGRPKIDLDAAVVVVYCHS